MNGCLVRFDGWHDAADIDSKTVFLHAGCVHIAPLDARFIATVEVIGRDLLRGDGLFRYVAPDDFGMPETSFTVWSAGHASQPSGVLSPSASAWSS